jgi:sugar lactone lactonase YvrE
MIEKTTGIIYTIAGTGVFGFNGNNVAADTAFLNGPVGLKFGIAGEDTDALFFCDATNFRVRVIHSGIITTLAGNDTQAYGGDGGLAVYAKFSNPTCICADKHRNLYITDGVDNVIRKIDAVTGKISTYAGGGTSLYGDGGPATSAQLHAPTGITTDTSGNIYFCDWANNVVRKIDALTGIISVIAGTYTAGFSGDSGLATAATLNRPADLIFDQEGNLFITDEFNNRIRKINAVTGIITTIAGNGATGFGGDNGPALNAKLYNPGGLCMGDSGIIYIADLENHRIRKLTPVPGTGVSEVCSIAQVPVIYPNPAQNDLYITNTEGQYSIADITGKILITGRLTKDQPVSIAALQSGLYFIQVLNKQGLKTNLRFVKE